MAVTGLTKSATGRVVGVEARDAETGETFRLDPKVVVNATGVFADALRAWDEPGAARSFSRARAHLVVDRRFLPGRDRDPRPQDRRRPGLVRNPLAGPGVDRNDRHAGQPAVDRPATASRGGRVPPQARGALPLRPTRPGRRSDRLRRAPAVDRGRRRRDRVDGRPLREHAVFVSRSGLVTVTGGKWTTYRRMAEDTVTLAAEVGGLPRRDCVTAELALHGAGVGVGAARPEGGSRSTVPTPRSSSGSSTTTRRRRTDRSGAPGRGRRGRLAARFRLRGPSRTCSPGGRAPCSSTPGQRRGRRPRVGELLARELGRPRLGRATGRRVPRARRRLSLGAPVEQTRPTAPEDAVGPGDGQRINR